jgi:hypothetical protein
MSDKINSTKKEKVGKLYVALEHGGEVEVPRSDRYYTYSVSDMGDFVELEVTANWMKGAKGAEALLDIDMVDFAKKYARKNNIVLVSLKYEKPYVFSFIFVCNPEVFNFEQESDKNDK